MKCKLILLYLTTVSIFALAQPTVTSKRPSNTVPNTSSVYDSSGYLKRVNAQGKGSFLKVDTSAIPGLGAQQAIQNQRINERTAYRTIATLRSDVTVPSLLFGAVNVTDKRQEGTFVFDPTDSATPDNGGTVLVDGYKRRWKRAYKGAIEVEWFGAVGSGFVRKGTNAQINAANAASARKTTQAIQAALDWAAYNGGTAGEETLYPKNKERPAVVHAPAGTYLIDQELLLRGAVKLYGDESMSFGGTAFLSWECPPLNIPAHHLFHIVGAPETGKSAATVLEKMRILGFNTSGKLYAAVYIGDEEGSSYNSCYFRDVAFQSGSSGWLAAWIKKGDDMRFINCGIDGAINTLQIQLGDTKSGSRVLNAQIDGCTIYDPRAGLVNIVNVDGLQFSNNRVYGTAEHRVPFVLYAKDAVYARGIQVTDNRFFYTNGVYYGNNSVLMVGNDVYESNSNVVRFTGPGGNIVLDAVVKDNRIHGSWPTAVNAPFFAEAGVAVGNCQFDNLIVDRTGKSAMAYYLPIQNELNTINPRGVVGFTTLTNNPGNGVLPSSYGTMAGQNANAVAITGGTAANLTNLSATNATFGSLRVNDLNVVHATDTIPAKITANWKTTTSYTLVPPAALPGGSSYFLYLSLNKVGVEVLYSVYLITIGATTASSPAPPPLTPLSQTAYSPASPGFKVSLLKPSANTANHGIGVTFADNNYAGALVTWRLVKAP